MKKSPNVVQQVMSEMTAEGNPLTLEAIEELLPQKSTAGEEGKNKKGPKLYFLINNEVEYY